jgi:membrane carboxypeptidase/penicillin-binding protein
VRIITTLDRRAQRSAQRELEEQLMRIERGTWGRFRGRPYSASLQGDEEGTEYLQGAVMLMEAETGDVLAWVGGREFRHSRFDRVDQARRQMGSAFKPFVFAAALGSGVLPTQQVSDLPLAITFAGGEVWEPRNFGDSYLPMVSVRQALVESRNVATVRLAETVGIDRVADLAERAGLRRISTLPSTALGADTASPLELARAYSAFANLGERVEPRTLLRIENGEGETIWEADDPERNDVLDPAVAFLVTDMMREAVRRGTAAPAAAVGLPLPAAGKTGTTNERLDVWFVGYTPDVVGTVWIGFDRPQTIVRGASGGRLAAPVWGRIVRSLYRHRDRPGAWSVPSGVLLAQVDRSTGAVIAPGCAAPSGRTYREVFLAGTEPPAACPGGQEGLWARLRGWWSSETPAGNAPPVEAAPTPLPLPTSGDTLLPPAELEAIEIGVLSPVVEPVSPSDLLEPAPPPGTLEPMPVSTPESEAPELAFPEEPIEPPVTATPAPVEAPPVTDLPAEPSEPSAEEPVPEPTPPAPPPNNL